MPPTSEAAATLLTDWPLRLGHHLSLVSLMHGWLPDLVQVLAAAVLLAAIDWRHPRRWALRLPAALTVGIATAVLVRWYLALQGVTDDPPTRFWVWIALTGSAITAAVLGWPAARWWRRALSLLAVPGCLLATALMVNLWVGYFPTVTSAWTQLTAGALPDQLDHTRVAAMAALQQARHSIPPRGALIPVSIPSDASRFKHRGELVYLPPAWFATSPPPALPTVMMIGGVFDTPADWVRAGNAIATVDAFAAAHTGHAPVLVFVDAGGTFNNDTECVNGPHGNAADHLTEDVVPYLIAHYGVSPDRSHWGVVGWSMGGTCAVDLLTMHPERFRAIEDIAGDLSPNLGDKQQTIERLYGGDATRWAAFDPSTVITHHDRYRSIAAWFVVNDHREGHDPAGDQMVAADTLCALGSAHGIDCAVGTLPGRHDWPFAASAFTAGLPWLAAVLGTPGVPAVAVRPAVGAPLPAGAPAPPAGL
ncbi:alpha/beta hydrolase [Mycolicibacterium palauense]|uniref:alpha/beta hydrolase n=1 Tax=Mycolicibacterium palauense TaxID=2034511 RepID=UPI001C3F397B